MISFMSRTVFITGAANGIGRATARLMARAGAHVALFDRDTHSLEHAANALRDEGLNCYTDTLDITNAHACHTTLERAARELGGIDALVHCAGIYPEATVSTMSDEQWKQLMAVNVDGTFFVCRAALDHLNDDSAIVTLASVAGHKGSYAHAHYAASKGAVSSFSKSLALELAPRTRVNMVAPGIIATSMTNDLVRQKGDALLSATPLQRFGTAEEVAGTIAFLCSDLSSFMTGQTLHVNGGLYIV